MPEIPTVVPGEPVESSWGNLVSARTIQRYADQTALDASQPFPDLGECVWLDDPGILKVWEGTAWVPLGDRSQPLSTFQQVERTGTAMAQWRRTGSGWVTHQIQSDGQYDVDVRDGEGQPTTKVLSLAADRASFGTLGGFFVEPTRWGTAVPYFGAFEVIGGSIQVSSSNFARVNLLRDDVPGQARLAFGSSGDLVVQIAEAATPSAPVTKLTVGRTDIRPSVPVRMAGNLGQRLHYLTGSSATLTPDFDGVWDAVAGSDWPTDQQLYRGAAAVMAADDPDLALADTQAPMAATAADDVISDITVHAITQNGKAGAVMTSPTWDQGGSVRPLVAALVRKVQDLEARLAALETP